ncbi:MAG: GNAT family N-acetyltransferase [Pseudobdellovibrionaceae bacterium]
MGHITLRPLQSADFENAFQWTGDPDVTQSLFWDAHESPNATQVFLKKVAETHPWFMAICFAGKPVGAITLDRGSGRGVKRAEMGYVVAKKYWGQGIATQAIRLCLARGFSDLDVERIEAFVDPENRGSVKVLEKAGLNKDAFLKRYVLHRGLIRDRFVFSALRPSENSSVGPK